MKRLISLTLVVLLVLSFIGCNRAEATTENVSEVKRASEKNTVETEKNIPEEYKAVIQKFNNVYDYKMPYFGGWKFSDYQVVVFNPDKKTAVLWNAGLKRETKMIDFNSLNEAYVVSSYSEGQVNGIKTIFVMNDGLDATFSLAVHEGYHFYGQEWLSKLNTYNGTPRGTLYPENVEARNLVNQMDYFVKSKLNGQDKDGIKKAATFVKAYQNNHAEDLTNNLDTTLAESTANFVEMLYKAVSNDPSLIGNDKKIAEEAFKLDRNMLEGDFLDKTGEYYKAGSSPLFYLASQGEKAKVDEVLNGIHPMVTLTKNVEPMIAKVNQKLQETVTSTYQTSNQMAKEKIEEIEKLSKEKVKVIIPNNAFSGSMEFGEFISYKVNNEWVSINTNTTGSGKTESGGTVAVRNLDTKNTPDYNFEIYVDKNDISIKDDQLTIQTNNIQIINVNYTLKDGVYTLQ